MKAIIILALVTISLSTDIILVGDSRTYLMACFLFGFPQNQGYIATSTPVIDEFNNKVQIVAKPGARVYDFISDQQSGIDLNNLLRKADPRSYVFLWLGINNIGDSLSPNGIRDTFNKYFELAQYRLDVNFIIFSIPGVDETRTKGIHDATNVNVDRFNAYMNEKVNQIYLPNLKFVNLMKNPLTTIDGIDILPYLYDGLHLDSIGCHYFYNKMVESMQKMQ